MVAASYVVKISISFVSPMTLIISIEIKPILQGSLDYSSHQRTTIVYWCIFMNQSPEKEKFSFKHKDLKRTFESGILVFQNVPFFLFIGSKKSLHTNADDCILQPANSSFLFKVWNAFAYCSVMEEEMGKTNNSNRMLSVFEAKLQNPQMQQASREVSQKKSGSFFNDV